MKVLFHTNSINYRGTTVAVTDYATYNQDILGNESIICYNESLDNDSEVVNKLTQQFQVVSHTDNIQQVINQTACDVAYFIRAGDYGFVSDSCKTVVHSVFQLYEPHGDRYAYVSEWLANCMNARHDATIPFVPHMVNLPPPNKDLRDHLGITAGQTVIGRIGGYDTFDLPFVHRAIYTLLQQRSDFVFVMMGTKVFYEHPNIRYVPAVHDLQDKSNLINACDAMVHARSNGESFGLSIAEFLSQNKPVLAWNGGEDKNHVLMLKGSGTLYTEDSFAERLLNIRALDTQDWYKRVEQFAPIPVMNKFKEVFL
jgi:glycosyltransferase involved in cell wall biosynthesis